MFRLVPLRVSALFDCSVSLDRRMGFDSFALFPSKRQFLDVSNISSNFPHKVTRMIVLRVGIAELDSSVQKDIDFLLHGSPYIAKEKDMHAFLDRKRAVLGVSRGRIFS